MKYDKSANGYYYKVYANGNKSRISKDEYLNMKEGKKKTTPKKVTAKKVVDKKNTLPKQKGGIYGLNGNSGNLGAHDINMNREYARRERNEKARQRRELEKVIKGKSEKAEAYQQAVLNLKREAHQVKTNNERYNVLKRGIRKMHPNRGALTNKNYRNLQKAVGNFNNNN